MFTTKIWVMSKWFKQTIPYLQVETEHIVSGYALRLIDSNGENKTEYGRGENCIEDLIKKLTSHANDIFNLKTLAMLPLTIEEEESSEKANKCWICKENFVVNDKCRQYQNLKKVRDHDHCTEKYRGAENCLCNLKHSEQRNISVAIHNGSN